MMESNIPLVDLAAQQREIADEVGPVLDEILERTAFVNGPQVDNFERNYASYIGVGHCIGVGNGTDALEMSLRAVGVRPGGEVVIPANTFIATAGAIARAGATPVLVDVDDDYLLIDPSKIEQAITERTQAIIPVHLFGQAAPVELVTEVLGGRDIAIVEDAAQAHGAQRHGARAGTLGLAAGTSFYPGKNLGAAGDAGAVLTSDGEVARKVRLMGNHGSERKYVHESVGFNSRLDTIHAAVLDAKLRRLENWNAARRAAAARYDELLSDVPGIRTPEVMPGNEHVWHLYVVRVARRDEVLSALNSAGVGAGIHYPQAIHQTGAFGYLATGSLPLPVAERAASEILSLPIYPHITAAQQERVADVLREAVRSR